MRVSQARDGKFALWQLTALAGLFDALARRNLSWEKFPEAKSLAPLFEFARSAVVNSAAPEDERLARSACSAAAVRIARPTSPRSLRC